MELWEERLIEEMHLLVDHLASTIDSRNKESMSEALSDLVILGETTSYLSGHQRDDEEIGMSNKIQTTILDLIDLWEKERGTSFNDWVNEQHSIQLH